MKLKHKLIKHETLTKAIRNLGNVLILKLIVLLKLVVN